MTSSRLLETLERGQRFVAHALAPRRKTTPFQIKVRNILTFLKYLSGSTNQECSNFHKKLSARVNVVGKYLSKGGRVPDRLYRSLFIGCPKDILPWMKYACASVDENVGEELEAALTIMAIRMSHAITEANVRTVEHQSRAFLH